MHHTAIFNNWNELFRLNNNSKTCSLLCWGIFRLSRSIQIDGHYMASRTIRELTWKEHIKLTENEIAKGIGIWFISRPYLDERTLIPLYYSHIHSYPNYENPEWCSTNRTYLKNFQIQQKHAVRIMFHENKFAHAQQHFKKNNVSKVFQLNIFNNLLFSTLSQKRKDAQCFSL